MGLFDRIERSGEAVANRLVHKDAQPLDTIEITSKLIETMDKRPRPSHVTALLPPTCSRFL